MSRSFLILFIIIAFATSCRYRFTRDVTKKELADSLVSGYIKQTSNKLIRQNSNNHMKEEWLQHQSEEENGVHYLTYIIGHYNTLPVADKKFVTDERVYVDTAQNKLYIYDVFAASLKEWKR